MPASLRRMVPLMALLLPFVPATALMGYVVAGWAAGANPFWPTPSLNVAEAALVRDNAEAVRLIALGQDPSLAWPVRAELRNDADPPLMTPLEAAIRIRRADLFDLLRREGARIAPEDLNRLIALAERSSAPEIAERLRIRD